MVIVNLNTPKNRSFFCQNYQRAYVNYRHFPCFKQKMWFSGKGTRLEANASGNVPESELTKHPSAKPSTRSKHCWWGNKWCIAAHLVSSSRCEGLAGHLPMHGEISTENACYMDASCWASAVVYFLSNSLEHRHRHAEHTHPPSKGPQSKLQGIFLNCLKTTCH